jgi:Fe-S-cluster containining protein
MEILEKPEATAEAGLRPLIALQENATQFFDAFAGRHSEQMTCTKGCSGCCHVDISIFTSEAARILGWIRSMDQPARQSLQASLRAIAEDDAQRRTPTAPNPTGQNKLPCAFLIDNACSIYPARPIICRTQGALLRWQTNKQTEPKKQKNVDPILQLDICPLNFRKSEQLPEDREALDLDRLTQLQSIAQQHWSNSAGIESDARTRISMGQLRELALRRLGEPDTLNLAQEPD